MLDSKGKAFIASVYTHMMAVCSYHKNNSNVYRLDMLDIVGCAVLIILLEEIFNFVYC